MPLQKFYTNIKENKHSINKARKTSKVLRVPDKRLLRLNGYFNKSYCALFTLVISLHQKISGMFYEKCAQQKDINVRK